VPLCDGRSVAVLLYLHKELYRRKCVTRLACLSLSTNKHLPSIIYTEPPSRNPQTWLLRRSADYTCSMSLLFT
jgi:hypothetical protein